MITTLSTTTPRRRGRPQVATLSDAEEISLARTIVAANAGRDAVSVRMAAWVWAGENRPDLLAILQSYSTKHTLPECIQRAARRVRGLEAVSRDRRRVSSYGVSTGRLRVGADGERLRAGERFSVDDLTANSACWVPWPQGGDACSDSYGVRLGRWQTLVAHCDATRYIPLYVSAIRWEQTYRGEDAVALVDGLCRTVCRPEAFTLEGGVWQGTRMLSALAAMGVAIMDAKGRPNLKLVENFFNTFHTRMAIELRGRGQVGRFRGEEQAWGELYVKCRAGKADPREYFHAHTELLDATDRAVRWLNEDRVESVHYGKWIPRERWEADMAETPRPRISEADAPRWATAPVLVRRTARRGQVVATAAGPEGESMAFNFCAPELVPMNGRAVRVAFDPWCPTEGATILEATRAKVLCIAAYTGAAAGRAGVDAVKALRAGVRRDLRILLPEQPTRREVLIREPSVKSVESVESIESSPRRATKTAPIPDRDWAAEAAENEAALSRRGALVIPCAIT